MDSVAIFVDAGYLFAQGSVALSGKESAPRDRLVFDASRAIEALRTLASKKAPCCRLLRVYWYDGARSGASQSTDHATLANLDDVKLRLGFLNSNNQQKGVDSLIVTDIIELARLKSISDAILLSGDEDVRIGVQIAQNYGVRVHLVGIHPARGSQSPQLQQEADTTTEWFASDVSEFLSVRELPTFVTAPATTSAVESRDAIGDAVKIFVAQLDQLEIDAIGTYWKVDRGVPPDLDRKLLPVCGQAIGRLLEREEIRLARSEFQKAVSAILRDRNVR